MFVNTRDLGPALGEPHPKWPGATSVERLARTPAETYFGNCQEVIADVEILLAISFNFRRNPPCIFRFHEEVCWPFRPPNNSRFVGLKCTCKCVERERRRLENLFQVTFRGRGSPKREVTIDSQRIIAIHAIELSRS
jgi:hypothetical protein